MALSARILAPIPNGKGLDSRLRMIMGQIEPSETDCLNEQDALSVMYCSHRKKSRKVRPSSAVKLFVRPASSVHKIKLSKNSYRGTQDVG